MRHVAMSLRFADLLPEDERGGAKRREPRPASGPLSVYGFDVEPAPEGAAPAPPAGEADSGPALVDEAGAVAPAPSIYGFHTDPDALAGEFLDLAAADEPAPAAPPPAQPPVPRPPTRAPSELLAEVAAALNDAPDLDDEDDDHPPPRPAAAPGFELPEGSWLDAPAGPQPPPPVLTTSKPTETVSAADVRPRPRPARPPVPPPAVEAAAPDPPPAAWGASTQEIAEELLKAVDEEKRGVAGSSEDDLAALLSAAIATSPERELPRRGAAAGPPLDPTQVPPGDFRAVAAGLIAELEASLAEPASHREEHP